MNRLLEPMSSTAIVGLQWGDEGKGKVVDLLAPQHDFVVRFNGGANAGHSVVIDGERFALHLLPSGVLCPGVTSVIGNGVVLDPQQLVREMDGLRGRGVSVEDLVISDRAHVVMPYHKAEDGARESILRANGGSGAIGTTGRGIGPAYAEKIQRGGAVRVGDLIRPEVLASRVRVAIGLKRELLGLHADVESQSALDEDRVVQEALAWGEQLRPFVADTRQLLRDARRSGAKILFEGANATLLDVDHGTYPFVTSSSPTVLGIGPGTGLPPRAVERVIGIAKAYQTRVGMGPMPTELSDSIGDRIRERGREFGTTTGRPRRCGWLDLVALRYAVEVNGVDELAVMLLDVLAGFDSLHICTAYRIDGEVTDEFDPDSSVLERAEPVYDVLPGFPDEITDARSVEALPAEARQYLERISEFVGVPISIVSVGPDRSQTIAYPREASV